MGISLELHSTFVILIAAAVTILAFFYPEIFFQSIVLIFLLFFSVFVHELFHSLVAVSKGFKVQKIILLPIGGISVAEELPEKPIDEFLISIAGPAFNFAIVFLIAILVAVFPQLPWPWHIFFAAEPTLEMLNEAIIFYPLFGLFWVNFILGAFNLFVPALPLDGGRVLRSLLAMKFGFTRATHFASAIARVLAIFLGVLGLFYNWILLIIAIFIYFGAGSEDEAAVIKEILRGIPVLHLVNPTPNIIDGKTTVADAYNNMLARNETNLLVAVRGKLGYVNANRIAQFSEKKWEKTSVSKLAMPLASVTADADAAKAMLLMISKGQPFVPVFDKGNFIGVIEKQQLSRLYKLKKVPNGK